MLIMLMRLVLTALFVWTCLGQIRGQASPDLPRGIPLAGESYAALADWAAPRDFKLGWLNKEDFQLTSRWAKLGFKVGSRKAEINGLTVWLSHPIYAHNEKPYISLVDLKTLIQPVLYPVAGPKRVPIKTIALDPGHGGKDPGNQAGKQQEKKHTLLLAKEVQKKLTAAGLKVTLTRSTDTYVELHDRPYHAKKQKADMLISLHYNSLASGKNGVRGIEVYCLTPAGATSTHAQGEGLEHRPSPGNSYDSQNILLAYQLQKNIVKNLNVEDRGLLRARWAVLRSAQMPAVLLEGGFMSDPVEAKRIFSDKYRRQLAQAIVDGVLAYKRTVDPAKRVSPPKNHPSTKPSAPRVRTAQR